MSFIIDTPNSPGTLFNKTTDEYIYQTYLYLESKPSNFRESYQEFQSHAIWTTKSYIRSIFPFLKGAKIINEYNSIINKELFTDSGRAYYICIDSIIKCKKENEILALDQFEKIKQKIIRQGLKNIIANKEIQYGKIFRAIINHLILYKQINEMEFALVLYTLQNNLSSQEYKSAMEQRQIDFYVRVTNKGTSNIKNETKITCFSYFMGSLISAGIVEKKCSDGFYKCVCDLNTMEDMI